MNQARECLTQALAIFEAIKSPEAERVRGRPDIFNTDQSLP